MDTVPGLLSRWDYVLTVSSYWSYVFASILPFYCMLLIRYFELPQFLWRLSGGQLEGNDRLTTESPVRH